MAKWFRPRKGLMSKDLGYGWVPITWEGWLVVITFIAVVTGGMFEYIAYDPKGKLWWIPLLLVFGSIGIVCIICHLKCDYTR